MRRFSNKGFTVIEAMEATALAALMLVGISSMVVGSLGANARARTITSAATAAEAKLEELRGISFNSLSSGSDTVAVAGASYQRSWTAVSGPSPGTMTVTVQVQGAYQIPVQLKTILTPL